MPVRPTTLLKKRVWHSCFPMNLAKFLKIPFYRISPGDCFFEGKTEKYDQWFSSDREHSIITSR